MEITAGLLKGFVLASPPGMTTRPTAVRARKALFDSLGPLDGLSAADLFAGSGGLGLEALSRGASSCLFVEEAAGAVHCIRKNMMRAAGILPELRWELIQGTLPGISRRLTSRNAPDLIFADPPYDLSADLLGSLLASPEFTEWAGHARLIWETDPARGGLKTLPPRWKLENIRSFGAARFFFFSVVPPAA